MGRKRIDPELKRQRRNAYHRAYYAKNFKSTKQPLITGLKSGSPEYQCAYAKLYYWRNRERILEHKRLKRASWRAKQFVESRLSAGAP
jgi:hypothetical protein